MHALLAATVLLFGHSAEHRPLTATRVGEGPVKVLVVGSIHGNETAGRAVLRQLRRARPPAGVELWLVSSVNPDGVRRGTRQNARGVDLNRNFGRRWRGGGRAFDTYFPGRRAFSEPETQAVRRLVDRIRPDVTIYYHQHLRMVDVTRGSDKALVRDYADRVGLPARTLAPLSGTATSWQNATFASTSAFVVELSAGPLSPAAARRHAAAVLAAGRSQVAPAPARAAAAVRPHIVGRRIPFGALRRAQMRAYARRHYGLDTAALRDPKVIVEHFTASSTLSSAFNTFAANAPDVELHERPGVCAHFIVDRDGTIYQLVSLRLMCRHTVGLNDVAIGIEHVGFSDAEILGRPAQLRASLRLTRWLQARYGIRRRDVIGHAESLSSPYHHERVARLRTQTHGDFARPAMRRYRRKL
ncbi:MAG: N-acetylmuramoyl-L-alanine amidase [Solirubrobacteraceae bacterium]